MEHGLSKNEIIGVLGRSPHGDLAGYAPVAERAVKEEGEFFAHFIAWNHGKGQIRDSKVALPVIGLRTLVPEFRENAMAHLALLSARDLLRSTQFALGQKVPAKPIRILVRRYLRTLESNWARWERVALQHRRSLHELYARFHVKPMGMADAILFKGEAPRGSVFEVVRTLPEMSPAQAASEIVGRKIPFLVAGSVMGKKLEDPAVLQAVMERMSSTDLVTNTQRLTKLGVMNNPALRATYEKGLEKLAGSKKNILKTSRAAEAVGAQRVAKKLRAVQEKQLDTSAVEGNWLVLADRSPSMQQAIEVSRQVAAALAKLAKGSVEVVFFDEGPALAFNAAGMTYEEISKKTRHMDAGGTGTSIGCGLARALTMGIEVDGIAVVSDAQENRPPYFSHAYQLYAKKFGKEVPVYLYRCYSAYPSQMDLASTCRAQGIDVQEFDLRHGQVDYYSLPALVATMRTNRYSLVDEIMGVPLKKLDEVLPVKKAAA